MKYYINVDRGMGIKTYTLVDAFGKEIGYHTKRKYARRHRSAIKRMQRDAI